MQHIKVFMGMSMLPVLVHEDSCATSNPVDFIFKKKMYSWLKEIGGIVMYSTNARKTLHKC